MGDKKTYFTFSFLNAIFHGVIFAYLSAGLDWIYHEAVNWLSALVAGLVYGSIMSFKSFYRMRFNARRAIIATAVFVTLWCLIVYCMDSPIHLRTFLFLSGVAALLGGFVENKKKP